MNNKDLFENNTIPAPVLDMAKKMLNNVDPNSSESVNLYSRMEELNQFTANVLREYKVRQAKFEKAWENKRKNTSR